jgi:hypothetical protein
MDNGIPSLSEIAFLKSLTAINDDIWLKNDFVNLTLTEPSLGIPSLSALSKPTSAYYFLLASAPENKSHNDSRYFTGNDTLFLSGNKLSYKNKNPKFNFDISGDFHTLSAYIETLSTNNFQGSSLYFNEFERITFNSDAIGNKNFYLNDLSADKVFVTNLETLSTVINYFPVPSICANSVFSSITWNVTAGGTVSAYNIRVKNNLISPFVSARNIYIDTLSANQLTIARNLTSLSAIYAPHIYGYLQLDPQSYLYYKGNTLSTRTSANYYFGVKPSDSNATDNINITRSLTGAWDSTNIDETLPVLKPYFRNIKQVFDYVKNKGLYGEQLNVLIYEDIVQDNVNYDGSFSYSGCEFYGNIDVRYCDSIVPQFLKDNGLKNGNYVWNKLPNTDVNGYINYWTVDRLNFIELNILGMYEIGSVINFTGKKQYTYEKPFNYSPRKISFRTYVSTNPAIEIGYFGSNAADWKSLSTLSYSRVFHRPVIFNAGDMDVSLQNLCFEFDCNTNDSTCLYIKSGNVYLNNITVAALNSANYSYGAILAWPKSTVYICGIRQIDPYLLAPTRWNNWTSLPTAKSQVYYPGYGLVIVGNPSSQELPTLFSNAFITTWRSKMFFMDYKVNRRIGNNSYLNASIILDGKFSAASFYQLGDHAKIFANNHVFKTNSFTLSNFDANIFTNTPYNGSYINKFENTNRDNFYYVNFYDSNATFTPNYFQIIDWQFNDANQIMISTANDLNNFTAKFVDDVNPNYIFNESTKTINLSGMVFGDFLKNSMQKSYPLNDNTFLYNYINPNDLPIYNTPNLYQLGSPINNSFIYTLNYYSSGGQTIIPKL